jgi:hypothetical protein
VQCHGIGRVIEVHQCAKSVLVSRNAPANGENDSEITVVVVVLDSNADALDNEKL